MTAQLYTRGRQKWNDAESYNALIVDSSHTFVASHEFVSTIAANEIASAGYARPGSFSLTADPDDAAGYLYLDGVADLTFGTLAASDPDAAFVIVYADTGVDATSTLLLCQAVEALMAADFPTVRVSSRGLVRLR